MRSAMNLAISVSLVAAQMPSPPTVSGQVAVPGGALDSPVHIELQRLGQTIQEQTSFDGAFQFRNVAPGQYTLLVRAPGYWAVILPADIPVHQELLIELRPVKHKDARESQTVSVGEYLYARAVGQFERERFNEARRLAVEAHECSIHPPDVHLLLANIYLKLGNEGSVMPQLRLYVAESKPNPTRRKIEELLR